MTNDLTFSGQVPVIINKNGSASDIFAPVRSSSCDINIVSPELLSDIYTEKKDEIKVKIEKDFYDKVETIINHPAEIEHIMVRPGWIENKVVIPAWDEEVVHSDGWGIMDVKTVDLKLNSFAPFKDIDGEWWWYDFYNKQWCMFDPTSDTMNADVNAKWGNYPNENYYYHYWTDGVHSFMSDGYDCYKWNDTENEWESYTFITNYRSILPFDVSKILKVGNAFLYVDIENEWIFLWNKDTMIWTELVDGIYNKLYLPSGEQLSTYYQSYYTSQSNCFATVSRINGVDTPVLILTNGKYQKISSIYKINKSYSTLELLANFGGIITKTFTDDDNHLIVANGSSTDEFYYFNNDHFEVFDNDYFFSYLTYDRPYIFANGHFYIFYDRSCTRFSTGFNDTWTEIVHHPAVYERVEHAPEYIAKIVSPAWDEKKIDRIYNRTEMIWEGYMTPNTYSQEITQNLDEIAVTAIDPVSILKYITLDKIMTRPNVVTYGDLIGKALSMVKLDSDILEVEQSVWYNESGTSDWNGWKEDNPNGVLDLKVQVANFWDEGDEPDTVYNVISEMLKPFCLTLIFTGTKYRIYDMSKGSIQRFKDFNIYRINDDGTLEKTGEKNYQIGLWNNNDWISNNVNEANMSINETYDKVTGVASTNPPSYSTMAIDLVDYNQRHLYDAFWVNVQRNKVHGWDWKDPKEAVFDDKDYWYYLWNGVYGNPEYGLEIYSDNEDKDVYGYVNMYEAYKYIHGTYPNIWYGWDNGSVLNFYGGAINPGASDKNPDREKVVNIKKRITSFTPVNGTPPEYLERRDLEWDYDSHWQYTDHSGFRDYPEIKKVDTTDSKWGIGKSTGSGNVIAYHQEYPNITLVEGNEQILELEMIQSYSRTGIDEKIDILHNSVTEARTFIMEMDEDYTYRATLRSGTVFVFPDCWNSGNVVFDYPYFERCRVAGNKLTPMWDKRRVDLLVNADDKWYQFDGKTWVELEHRSDSEQHCFYLKKLMNFEKVFHTDYRYNLVEAADGTEFALNEDGFSYRTGGSNSVDKKGSTNHPIKYYLDSEYIDNDWMTIIKECGEGNLSITLPNIDAVNATVICDVFRSSLLGTNGAVDGTRGNVHNYTNENDDIEFSEIVSYQLSGLGYFNYGTEYENTREIGRLDFHDGVYDSVPRTFWKPSVNFMPACVTNIKAEHLDLSIAIKTSESNLGQMFGESDIKYSLDLNKHFVEKYDGPTFNVNTYHPLVNASFSYLIFNNEIANPDKFIINNISTRPECYVVQAYINYLSKIRRVYEKTLVPNEKEGFVFDNVDTFITTPELNHKVDQSPWLCIVSDSIDLKTNRHTIEAVEDYDMNVDEVQSLAVVEVPRKSRNEAWNYSSAIKKK